MVSCSLFFCTDGVSFLNEDGGLSVFFPRNSFVTNTTLTHTNNPRSGVPQAGIGNNHIVCYGGTGEVAWHNITGPLQTCVSEDGQRFSPCGGCGSICTNNGGVGLDPRRGGHTNIHMFIDSTGCRNQDLQCRVVRSRKSAFIGVYLKNGGGYKI